MASYPGCLVALCILAVYVQNALSCCGGCGFPTSGGNFVVSSYSSTPPVGIAICSENVYEGSLCVQGNLPLLGSAALEGQFGTTGVGEVCYTCGDGDIGIDSTGCCCASGGSCCNKCGCSNAGYGCNNIGSCSCDVGGCRGNAGSCCNDAGGCCSNVGSHGCDFGSVCDNCRCGSINIGSCCCDLGSCCNNAGGCCSNFGSCGCDFGSCGCDFGSCVCDFGSCYDNYGCGCTNSGICCGKCACDKCISLNIHPDCCFNINPMWTVDPSSICLCPSFGFNIDNGPSSCCQCSNSGFNIDNCLDCCKCQDCCQCSGNGFSSNSNFGSGNGFSNSNSFALLKRFGLSGCWYPGNMYSSPFGRRLHELLHGNDCDCGFDFGSGCGFCSC